MCFSRIFKSIIRTERDHPAPYYQKKLREPQYRELRMCVCNDTGPGVRPVSAWEKYIKVFSIKQAIIFGESEIQCPCMFLDGKMMLYWHLQYQAGGLSCGSSCLWLFPEKGLVGFVLPSVIPDRVSCHRDEHQIQRGPWRSWLARRSHSKI